jgi:hypothetical protein
MHPVVRARTFRYSLWLGREVKALAASIRPTSVHSLPIHYYIAPALWGLGAE